MSKTSTRRTSRLTTPVMITFGVVAALLLGLTITSVVKAMTRGDDPVTVNEVLTGQSMEVNRTTGLDVIRFQSVRSPLPPDENVEDTLDTCMSAQAREHLESLAGEGTSLDVEIEAYANAPNGELWAEIYSGGDDLALQMVEGGYAVVDPESVANPQKLDELLAAQENARHNGVGIFSQEADCTLPSQVQPVLEMLEDLPSSPTANDVTELTAYLGEMNRIRSNAQQAVAMLSAIPDTENDDSVAALAWGDAKQEYINTIETRLEDLRGLIEDAQDKRADLQGSDAPEREPEPESESEDSDENASPEPEPEPTEPPAEEQTATEPAPEQDPVEQTTVEPAADVPDNVETNDVETIDVETEDVPVTQPTSEDTAQPQSQVESSDPQLGTAQ